MKYLLFLIPLLVLAACAETQDTAPTTQVCPDGTVVGADEECAPVGDQTPDAAPNNDASAPDGSDPYDVFKGDRTADESTYDVFRSDEGASGSASAELGALIDRAEEKTSRGITFTYDERVGGKTLQSPLQGSRVALREDAAVVELADEVKNAAGEEATHVVLTAEGAVASCPGCGMPPEPFSVEASDYEFIPPLRWLETLENDVFGQTLNVDGRNAYVISGTVDGEAVTVYADSFSGVPVQVKRGERVIRYRDLALSSSALFSAVES